MIPSHMRYNSPVERKAERGDSDGRETARKAGLGERLRFLFAPQQPLLRSRDQGRPAPSGARMVRPGSRELNLDIKPVKGLDTSNCVFFIF